MTASAGSAGAMLQLLEQARASMGLPSALAPPPAEPGEPAPKADFRRAAARCWALLLVRIYECLPLGTGRRWTRQQGRATAESDPGAGSAEMGAVCVQTRWMGACRCDGANSRVRGWDSEQRGRRRAAGLAS